ncbi:MAG: hypothetical protein SAJ12_09385 [Jaaginema sp. PMC 1079.18]|nr:hypothetical protein [Jaaginema sp. PMC 1080.18]MEC4851212.1 hypothetical protein [Jaaginema sp. PMC 1079.18]MEC4865683.1 hypothetical protein [Jaaginema sp. PMC 1078.18]
MIPIHSLEQYTLKRPQEVLILTVILPEGEEDQIIIFKGFSSSLMRPTAFDPDVPILPTTAQIISIDRALSPYLPDNPQYIARDLTPEDMAKLLRETEIS